MKGMVLVVLLVCLLFLALAIPPVLQGEISWQCLIARSLC